MKKEAMVLQQLLMDVQECIELICMQLERKSSVRVSTSLNVDLKSLIEKQVVIVTELFEKFKIEPKVVYYYVKPGVCVKINTGAASVNKNDHKILHTDRAERFPSNSNKVVCADCTAAKYAYKIVMVPHGYTKAPSAWGEGVPVYRYQCTKCGNWQGGFILERIVNAGL